MAIAGLGSLTALHADRLAQARAELTDLQRQLGTGKKAQTYGGLGPDRGLAAALRRSLSGFEAFQDTIDAAKVRLELMQTTLTRIGELGREAKHDTIPGTVDILSGGQTAAQKWNKDRLSEMLGILNTRAGDRYLFSGTAGTSPAVESVEHLLDGDGTRAGFRQVLSERRRADLGAAPAQGRLGVTIDAVDTSQVEVTEDGDHPFGFKVAAASTTIAGATVTVVTAGQGSIEIDLAGTTPAAGDTVTLTFDLPDGTTKQIALTATSAAAPAPGEFAIVAGDTAATAANLRGAIETMVRTAAATELVAASALRAGTDFFEGAAPQRVVGSPETATALAAGTAADTMTWYVGEDGATADRATMTAKVDTSITIQFGARANEDAIRWQVRHVAVFASATFDGADPNARNAYLALTERLAGALDVPPGTPRIDGIQAEIGGAQSALKAAEGRHTERIGVLEGLLGSIEDADPQEVGAQILQAQMRLQASLQVTAMMSRISLVQYL